MQAPDLMNCQPPHNLLLRLRASANAFTLKVSHALIPGSRKYKDIPDLTSDTVGSAYLGMTRPGKQRKVVGTDG